MKSKGMWRWLLLSLAMALLVAAVPAQELHPTPWSVDFLGQQSVLDGALLAPGALVRAYDPAGNLAGRQEVTVAGVYLMAVYRDDPATPEIDEGALPGDGIAFTVDGHPAVALGPDAAIWDENELRLEVELRACSLAGDFDCDCQVSVADLQVQAGRLALARGQDGYYPPYDRNGDGVIAIDDLRDVAGRWQQGC